MNSVNHRFPALTSNVTNAAVLLASPNANRLFIDMRLGEPAEEYRSYLEQHIHGAVHAQIRDVFASPPDFTTGNLPLPDISQLQAQLRTWGVNTETEIIVYGPSLALAARGWWTLRWAGLKNVKVLDGGVREWIVQGGAVAQGDYAPRLTKQGEAISLAPGHLPQIQVDDLERLAMPYTVIDARDETSYSQGHLPYAVNVPSAKQCTPSGRLRTVKEVQDVYAALGIHKEQSVVIYCGAGVLSALSVLLLDALGVRPCLYVGSWSQWARTPERIARSLQAARESA